MKQLTIKYIGVVGTILFLFVNFIACGSQLYQVSMDKDFEDHKLPPEAKDPTSTTYGIHAASGWKSLPINFRFGSEMNKMQKDALSSAMRTWDKTVGKTLFKFIGNDRRSGDSFPDLYSSLTDGVNGNYLDSNWGKTQKPVVVLATTIWDNALDDPSAISTADIRFNAENYTLGDSLLITSVNNREVVDMESVALHELGHLLGLAHVEGNIDPMSIMNPKLFIGEGLTSRKVSRSDVDRIQLIYGCKSAACDVDALMQTLSVDPATPVANEYPAAESTEPAH